MKRKISQHLFLISVFAVLFSVISVTFVYYNLFKIRIMEDLRTYAELLSKVDFENTLESKVLREYNGIRITLIGDDGSVLYDNESDPARMKNHVDRPEVKQAIETGRGQSVRKSETLQMRTYNYALQLENGKILRVSSEAQSIFSVYISALPAVFFVVIIVLFICLIISNYLTRRILKPIEKMTENLDNISGEGEYKELEPFANQIRKQHEDILSAAKVRQDFTANVSHELKTPLTVISGYAELIEQDMIEAGEVKKYAGQIYEHSKRLVNIINDTIKLSELDYEELIPELIRFDLYELLKNRVDDLKAAANNKHVKIEMSGENTMVYSDKNMMSELIDNLILNAIRYNIDNGMIMVSVFTRNDKCVLKIADSGIGIPTEELSRIFERFYRVDRSHSGETGGTGLGLAIVKHITEILGYTIDVESEVGKGTVFSVYI